MPADEVIPYTEARRRKSGSPQARWPNIAASFAGEVWPQLQPSFRIARGQSVFTIGSCFARNIEEHLVALGCRVPMMDFNLPPDEWSGGANGAMNRFHPPAFRQCLEWTATIFDRDGKVGWDDCKRLAFECGPDQWFDMDMGATAPVSQARIIERRQHIYEVFSAVFTADCLMMTPGLVEAWRDTESGLFIHEAPTLKAMVARRERWELAILSSETCRQDMLKAIDVVRARNPGVKVLVTTSPVPMTATFSGQDVRVANTYSKSVLRAVCGEIALQRPMVDYFPSYEAVTLSHPDGVWREDRIHVAHGFIGKIAAYLLEHYLDGVDDSARLLQQAQTQLAGGAFASAEADARNILATTPDHLEARAVLAEALLRQHRCLEAERELVGLIAANPERPDLRVSLARAIVRGDSARAPEAIAHVEAAAAMPGISLGDFRSVAALVRQRAAARTAVRIGRAMIEAFPLNVEAYPLLIDVLIDQGRTSDARAVLEHAIQLRHAPADLFVKLARLSRKDRPAKELARLVETALALDANHPGALALREELAHKAPAG